MLVCIGEGIDFSRQIDLASLLTHPTARSGLAIDLRRTKLCPNLMFKPHNPASSKVLPLLLAPCPAAGQTDRP